MAIFGSVTGENSTKVVPRWFVTTLSILPCAQKAWLQECRRGSPRLSILTISTRMLNTGTPAPRYCLRGSALFLERMPAHELGQSLSRSYGTSGTHIATMLAG